MLYVTEISYEHQDHKHTPLGATGCRNACWRHFLWNVPNMLWLSRNQENVRLLSWHVLFVMLSRYKCVWNAAFGWVHLRGVAYKWKALKMDGLKGILAAWKYSNEIRDNLRSARKYPRRDGCFTGKQSHTFAHSERNKRRNAGIYTPQFSSKPHKTIPQSEQSPTSVSK